MDREHVGGRAREAHDVAPAARVPEPTLELCHRADRREDLPGGRGRLLAPRAELLDRGPDDGGVLPDLELRQVEPERLRLPEEVLELPVGEPLRAGGGQRPLDDAEVVPEGVRVGVPAARPSPGRRQAMRGQAPASVGAASRPAGARALRRPPEGRRRLPRAAGAVLGRRRCVPLGGGQGPGDAPRLRLETEQDVLRRDLDRAPGHVRRHVWVAVPVAADPGPPSEERPVERRRACPGAGRERAIHLAGHDGQHVEDRLVEQGHLGAHLVQWLWTTGADLVGAPQRRHLLHQASIDVQRARSQTAARGRAVPPARRSATGSRRSRVAAPRSDAP